MNKRILIIDDDLDMCILLTKFLNRKGYEAEAAHSGAKGLAKFKEGHFDIVLCDFRLGDKDGKDVLVEIKEYCTGNHCIDHHWLFRYKNGSRCYKTWCF